MHGFLTYLARRKARPWAKYAATIALLILITAFRIVVPLDVAPFLLYLPVVFLLAVAFGERAGVLAIALSCVAAASFFSHPGPALWQLTGPQWIAVCEYLIVGAVMIRVCGALRKVIHVNEAAVERLRASEAGMRAILDTVPVGILFAEAPSGRIVGRNKLMDEIVGTANGEVRSLADYGRWRSFHADGRPVEAADYPLARVIRREARDASLEVHYERRDGRRMWLELHARPMEDEAGTLTGAVVAVSDIDRRKRSEAHQASLSAELRQRSQEAERARAEAEAAQEAAEAANRAKSAFLANMSHELRTPLSAVIGYTELLEEEASDVGEPALLTDLAKIKSNAKHLLSLINDVLDLSKVEANKMEVIGETVAVADFVTEVATTVDALMRQKNNLLDVDLGPDLGTMHTDAVKLRQCLFNLLGNAGKFTEGGRVTLRVRRQGDVDGGEVLFAVADTGIGMTSEQVSRLFQRFTQADESTTRRFGGTGLGLALTRALARLLGGGVDVESRLGEGTTFTLRIPATLPRAGSIAEAAARHEPADDSVRSLGDARPLVLVIDDEASQRELLTRFLNRQNYAVCAAGDGVAGLELARSLRPRVILLDVMMPKTDGWTVLRTLKADPATADIPVVIVSFVADARPQTSAGISLGASLGASEIVSKPIDWGRLKLLLDRLSRAGGSVLVVDDDADLRARLRAGLERHGWAVREAADGAQALVEVARVPPHVILLDLAMPVMDGFAFLDELRDVRGGAEVPVVVLSARDVTASERERLAEAKRVLRKDATSMDALAAELRAVRPVAQSIDAA